MALAYVICLDKPTSASFVISFVKVFKGNVLVITHNRDFTESLCEEVWVTRDGRLEVSGHNWVEPWPLD